MKLQKYILCAAIALTAFGASLGLLEIGAYLRSAFAPVNFAVKEPKLLAAPVVYPQNIPDFKQAEPAPPVESEPEAEPEDWGKNGYYYIIGDEPQGFKDFQQLELTTHEWNEKTEKPVAVKPYGEMTANEKKFKLSWLNITGNRISFITRERRGVSYQFDGRFIDAEEVKYKTADGEEYTDAAYLKGRLTKWKNGKKIAEAKVKFGIHHGC